MNALKLFKYIILPHLWLSPKIFGIDDALLGGALGLAGGLFGGGSSSPSAVSGIKAQPKWLQDALKRAQQEAQGLYGSQQPFEGPTVAPATPGQLGGLESQVQAAQGFAENQLPNIFGSFGTALDAGNIFSDPSVQAGLGTIESRGTQNFLENVLPGLRRGATASGGEFGTRGELAAGVAGSRLGRDIGDSQAQFLASQLASARGLQGQTIGNAPNVAQLGALPGQAQFAQGSFLQGQQQNTIDELLRKYNFPQDQLNAYLGQLGQISGAGAGASVTPNTSGTNPFAAALGGAQLGGLIAPSFTSPAGSSYTNPSPFGAGIFG